MLKEKTLEEIKEMKKDKLIKDYKLTYEGTSSWILTVTDTSDNKYSLITNYSHEKHIIRTIRRAEILLQIAGYDKINPDNIYIKPSIDHILISQRDVKYLLEHKFLENVHIEKTDEGYVLEGRVGHKYKSPCYIFCVGYKYENRSLFYKRLKKAALFAERIGIPNINAKEEVRDALRESYILSEKQALKLHKAGELSHPRIRITEEGKWQPFFIWNGCEYCLKKLGSKGDVSASFLSIRWAMSNLMRIGFHHSTIDFVSPTKTKPTASNHTETQNIAVNDNECRDITEETALALIKSDLVQKFQIEKKDTRYRVSTYTKNGAYKLAVITCIVKVNNKFSSMVIHEDQAKRTLERLYSS